jgi:hypothetical protein
VENEIPIKENLCEDCWRFQNGCDDSTAKVVDGSTVDCEAHLPSDIEAIEAEAYTNSTKK